jgi:hypothetical protein
MHDFAAPTTRNLSFFRAFPPDRVARLLAVIQAASSGLARRADRPVVLRLVNEPASPLSFLSKTRPASAGLPPDARLVRTANWVGDRCYAKRLWTHSPARVILRKRAAALTWAKHCRRGCRIEAHCVPENASSASMTDGIIRSAGHRPSCGPQSRTLRCISSLIALTSGAYMAEPVVGRAWKAALGSTRGERLHAVSTAIAM